MLCSSGYLDSIWSLPPLVPATHQHPIQGFAKLQSERNVAKRATRRRRGHICYAPANPLQACLVDGGTITLSSADP